MKCRSLFLILLATALFLYSCADPIDRNLIQVAEDVFPPELVEISPENNSLYYSTVTVEGIVEDHSLIGGDGEGRLVSFQYNLSNNSNRKGKIFIDENGDITADSSWGDGGIDYNAGTGDFSFTFSTIEFERDGTVFPDIISGYMTIIIVLEDANENDITYQINLRENENPYLYLIEPGTAIVNYEADDNIEIYGNIANSSEDMEYNDEIVSLEWMLTMMPNWRQTIDLTALTPESGGYYEVQSLEDAIGTPTFRFYPQGSSDLSLPGNPQLPGYFYSLFVAPAIEGNLSFRFNVLDKRGGEITESIDISSKLLSPVFSNLYFSGVGVYFNSSDSKYYYSSNIVGPGDVVFHGKLSDNGDIPEVKYKIRTNGVWLSENVGYSGTVATGATFSFNVSDSDLTTSPGYYSQVRIEGNNGTGTGYATKIIYDDNQEPQVSINTFQSNNSNSPLYARLGDTITLNFTIVDQGGDNLAISGLSGDPVVEIANHNIPLGGGLVDNGNGNYSATYTMGSIVDTILNDDMIPYRIRISDNVGNEADVSASLIRYYETAPLVVPGSIIVSSDTAEDPEWLKAGESITIPFTISRDLLSTPSVTVSDNSNDLVASVSGSGPAYSAEYTLSASDDDNSGAGVELAYEITVSDAAGNSNTYNSGTNVWFDRTAPSAPNSISSSTLGGSYISGLINDFDIDINLTGSGAKTGDTIELLLDNNSFGGGYDDLLSSLELSAYEFPTVLRSDLGSDGLKSFTARIIDIAGNSGPESNPAFQRSLDTAPPSISGVSYNPDLSSGSRIRQSGSDSITISATIADSNGLDPSNYPTLKMGSESAVVMTNTTGDIWEHTWTYPSANVEDVNYQAVITATDIVGNNVSANGRTFVLDNVVPATPSLSSSTISAGGYVNGESEHADFDIVLTYSGADVGDTIELFGLSVPYSDVISGGETTSYTFTVDRDHLASGDIAYALSARLTDIAGNVGLTSSNFNFTLDTAAPSAPNALSSDTITGTYINSLISTFDIDIDLTGSNAAEGDTVELLLGGSSFGSGYSDTLLASELTGYEFASVSRTDLLSDGSKAFTARVIDVAGNIGAESSDFTLTLDDTLPAIGGLTYTPNISDLARIRQSGSDTIIISATITDASGLHGTNVPTIKMGSEATVEMTHDTGDVWEYEWTIPSDAVENVNYQAVISATDDAGNVNSANGRTFVLDNVAPAGYSIAPGSFSILGNNVTITVDNITEGYSWGIVNYRINPASGGNLDGSSVLTSISGGSITIIVDVSTLNAGVLLLEYISVEDAAGNTGSLVPTTLEVTKL